MTLTNRDLGPSVPTIFVIAGKKKSAKLKQKKSNQLQTETPSIADLKIYSQPSMAQGLKPSNYSERWAEETRLTCWH